MPHTRSQTPSGAFASMRKPKKHFSTTSSGSRPRERPRVATRDLVDVYRSLGQYEKAISLIDRDACQEALGRNKAGSSLYQGKDPLQPGEVLHRPSGHSTAQRLKSPIHGRRDVVRRTRLLRGSLSGENGQRKRRRKQHGRGWPPSRALTMDSWPLSSLEVHRQ